MTIQLTPEDEKLVQERLRSGAFHSVAEVIHHTGKVPPGFDIVQAIRVKEGALQGCTSTHGLAEFYSVITRAPFTPRVHPTEAGRFLDDNIL